MRIRIQQPAYLRPKLTSGASTLGIGLDEVIDFGNGYPEYIQGSKEFKANAKPDRWDKPATDKIRLKEDVILRNGRTLVQLTGMNNLEACSMQLQLMWGPYDGASQTDEEEARKYSFMAS